MDFEIKTPTFKKLIEETLTRIPNKYIDEFPMFSIYEGFAEEGAMVVENRIRFDVSRLFKKSEDKDVLTGVIAHELAHVYHEHGYKIETNPKEGMEYEDQADKLSMEWGFVKEIEAFRKKFGPSTDGIGSL